MWRVITVCIGSLLASIVLAAPAQAQGAIVGVAKDSTGAVLPGVTVEASSPALIERIRTATTDSEGRYRIADLRPGVYGVMATLSGFSAVKRDGITLTATFTAEVNVTLQVGDVSETITVTGETPVVDLRNSLQETTMTREKLDTIPNARNIYAQAALTPGVQEDRFDVGGLQGQQEGTVQVHGSDSRDQNYSIDGMTLKSPFGQGNTSGFYFGDGMFQEVSFLTSALPAEYSQGGVAFNMVLRDGGNAFRGYGYLSGAPAKFQSDNLSPELKARGLQTANDLIKIFDANISYGGPIVRDRIWFFGSYRRERLDLYSAGLFNIDGSRALDDNQITDKMIRTTLQLNKANKVFGFYERNDKFRGHRRDTAADYQFIDSQAAIYQTTPTGNMMGVKWTSTLTNKLVLEAGYSVNDLISSRTDQPGATDSPQVDFIRSTLTKAYIYNLRNRSLMGHFNTSLGWVSGAHAFKAGVQYGQGSYRVAQNVNGDMVIRFRDGVPDTVDLYNSPTDARQNVDLELGVFAQDSWTVWRRLTINPGVRLDKITVNVPGQTAPAGAFVGARNLPEINDVPNWTNVVPRLGVTFDPIGAGKTVIKGGVSKYVTNQGTDLAQSVNPMILSTNRCRWTDLNLNRLVDTPEITNCNGFGGGLSTRIDPDLVRPANWEYTIGIEHELRPGFGVGTTYYRRQFIDQIGTRNLAVKPENYSPVTITNPLTLAPMTVYNQSAATRGLQDNFQTNDPELRSDYDGVEMRANLRLKKSAYIGSSLTVGRKEGPVKTTDLNNPNVLVNNIGALSNDSTYQFKLHGAFPLPGAVNISGAFQSSTGWPLRRTFSVSSALVPGLVQASQAIDLIPSGDVRLESKRLLDLRLAKLFRVGTRKFELHADLYNILNENAPTAEVQAFGSSLGRPSNIVDARTFKLGINVDF